MARLAIAGDTQLKPGDVVVLTFRTSSNLWLMSTEIAMIENYFEGRPDIELLSNSLPQDGFIEFKFLIKSDLVDPGPGKVDTIQKAGVPITPLVVGGMVVACGLMVWLVLHKAWLVLHKAERLVDSTAGQIALAGAGSAGIALLLFVAYKLLK